jgi:Berberine and berberine like
MRAHGLACDYLVGAEVVTADGRTLHANATDNPDLFWALRGGGGNFGVVTRFEFATVVGGMTLYPATRAAGVLRYFREVTASAPDELTALFGFLTAPKAPFVPVPMQGKPAVAIVLCCSGDVVQAQQTVRGIKRWGPPAVDLVGPMPYLALQSMLDAGAPSGANNYSKAGHLDRLDDAAIDTLVEHAARMGPGLSQVHLQHMGGAVARVPGDATAFANRQAVYAVNVIGMWTDPTEADRHVAWARGFSEALQPHTNGRVYVNFLGEEGEERVRAAYGPEAYARLARVKAAYDPENVFRLKQDIRPAGAPTGK